MIDASNLEGLAAALEARSDYRVLRRLRPRGPVEGYDAAETRLGLMVDVEATGLDPDLDEIIELAMVPFRYALDGMIVEVLQPFDRLREPTKPISPVEFKDFLKARGYRWNGEGNGKPRSWYFDVADAEKDAEISYLLREIYRYEADIRPVRVTAYDRFCSRI